MSTMSGTVAVAMFALVSWAVNRPMSRLVAVPALLCRVVAVFAVVELVGAIVKERSHHGTGGTVRVRIDDLTRFMFRVYL